MKMTQLNERVKRAKQSEAHGLKKKSLTKHIASSDNFTTSILRTLAPTQRGPPPNPQPSPF